MLTVMFICLLGSTSDFAHALAIPDAQNGVLLRRGGIVNDPLLLVELDKRANPAKPKPAGGSPAKPAPAPAPKPPAKATPKVTPTPAAKPVAWPDVKVLYVTTAIDTCGLLSDCNESHNEGEEIVARAFTNAHITHDVLVPRPTSAPIRRDIHTYKPKGAKLTIRKLGYPGVPDLFSSPKGANVMGNVFDLNSPNNSDCKVKNMMAKPASYDGCVTEHIVELQTIMLFINSVAKMNPKIKSFVETWWNKELDPATVASRPYKPLINMGDQKTINNLVFEALGSNNNREDFVLCEEEINGYKARLWDTKNPMAVARYKKAVTDAVSGGTDSNLYLSALRSYLEEDQKVASFKKAGAAIKMPTAV